MTNIFKESFVLVIYHFQPKIFFVYFTVAANGLKIPRIPVLRIDYEQMVRFSSELISTH